MEDLLTIATTPFDHTGVVSLNRIGGRVLETFVELVPHPRRWLFLPTTNPAKLRLYYSGADTLAYTMATAVSERAISALVVGPAEELELMLPAEAVTEVDRAKSPADAIVHLARKPYHLVLIDHTAEGDVTKSNSGTFARFRRFVLAQRPLCWFHTALPAK